MDASFVLNATAADCVAARERLLPDIHAVDRDAVRIWCQFYPLTLADTVRAAEGRDALIRQLRIRGDYDLATHAEEHRARPA